MTYKEAKAQIKKAKKAANGGEEGEEEEGEEGGEEGEEGEGGEEDDKNNSSIKRFFGSGKSEGLQNGEGRVINSPMDVDIISQ